MSQTSRILVVDDDPAILQLFSTILRAQGYEVWEATTAHWGLQLTREQHPELVLLDIMLPDLSGLEVCRQIKADPTLEDVFVVLISGLADSATQKVEGLASGADDYLTRPVDLAEFLARIRTMLRLRQVSTALRASEQHCRHLLEILPDAFGFISTDGRLLAVNPQAVAMLGYAEASELLQKIVFDLFPARERDRIEAELNQTLETGFLRNAQYELVKKDGHSLPVELSASVMKDAQGRKLGVVCVVRDITERKQSENIQRESEARFRQLAENIREVFWMTNPAKTEMLYISPAYEEIWGRSCRKLYESPRDWIEAIHPDDRERVLRQRQCGLSLLLAHRVSAF